MQVTHLYSSQCILAESALWHQCRHSYFWVDIEGCKLFELKKTGQAKVWELDKRVSLIVEQADENSLLLALQGELAIFNLNSATCTALVDIDKNIPQNRCNDGGCDEQGRMWIGTMDVHCKEGAGSLYRVGTDLQVQQVVNDLTIPNGIAWSADKTRMYFIETMSRSVRSYIFNKETGDVFYEAIAVKIPDNMGFPDGMCIDAEGMLWIALYSGGAVSRWNPQTGQLLQKIELPVPNVTNCCFSGDNLDELFVTTARENLTEQQLQQYPQSGDVFKITGLGVTGTKVNVSNFNIKK